MSRWSLARLESRRGGFALGPVHLDLAPGHSVAVVGRSGAGKTTLLRTVAGFLPATRGQLVRDGVDLTSAPPERRAIGYVPQGLGLFPHRTVEQNVRYPLELRRRSDARSVTDRLLRRFGLDPLARRRPGTLSSGQAQKVALARALASEPQLLLWDEPAHALDIEARDELAGVFREMGRAEGIPLLLVSHDPVLAFALADRFLLLDTGRVTFAGSSSELIGRPPDAYAARFAGFENLLSAELTRSRGGEFGRWLAGLAGPDGVAFPSVGLDGAVDAGRWNGIVDAVRPGPDGVVVDLAVDGLTVRARGPRSPLGERFVVGRRVRFDLPAGEVRALGTAAGAPEVAA